MIISASEKLPDFPVSQEKPDEKTGNPDYSRYRSRASESVPALRRPLSELSGWPPRDPAGTFRPFFFSSRASLAPEPNSFRNASATSSSHLIAFPADGRPDSRHQILRAGAEFLPHAFHRLPAHSPDRAPPAGMGQSNGPMNRIHKKQRDAVRVKGGPGSPRAHCREDRPPPGIFWVL